MRFGALGIRRDHGTQQALANAAGIDVGSNGKAQTCGLAQSAACHEESEKQRCAIKDVASNEPQVLDVETFTCRNSTGHM